MRIPTNLAVAIVVVPGLAFSQTSPSQQAAPGGVPILSGNGQRAELTFDDSNRELVIKSKDGTEEIGYDNIEKAVFEVITHIRGMGKGAGGASLAGGPLVGALVASGQVNDSLCTLDYKAKEGSAVATVLTIDKGHAEDVQERMKASLGAKVEVPVFPEPQHVDKEYLKQVDRKSKAEVHIDKQNRPPLPEVRADKALAFFLCWPSGSAGAGPQFWVHANDQVVAVNKSGTYSYAYLAPGEYILISHVQRARAGLVRELRVKLEAGKDYYFYQSELGGWTGGFTIAQHSRELARAQLPAFYYSNWKIK